MAHQNPKGAMGGLATDLCFNVGYVSGVHTIRPHAGSIRATADGKNPAPVDMVNIPLFTGFHTSQVVQDFFHQQYLT